MVTNMMVTGSTVNHMDKANSIFMMEHSTKVTGYRTNVKVMEYMKTLMDINIKDSG